MKRTRIIEIEETIRELSQPFQSELVVEALIAETPEAFTASRMVGACPRCRSTNVSDGEDVEGINDICVGVCRDCGQAWCLECGAIFPQGQVGCGHWAVCGSCEKPRGDLGFCGVEMSDCPSVLGWAERQSQVRGAA